MNKIIILLIVGVFTITILSITSILDQSVGADIKENIHFTQTITSAKDLGQENQNHQLALILPPNEGTIYVGSMTFTSSVPVEIIVLHEIHSKEAQGQPIWTVDGDTVYGLSTIDINKQSGSFEFVGAAIALHSLNSKEFTATVSIDASIHGQPTDILLQKVTFEKADPVLPLSRTSVPAIIPMHKGIHDGDQIYYIITDSSNQEYAKYVSEKQKWNVELAKPLVDVPNNTLQILFAFKNGIEGDGIYGFQHEVFSSTPSQKTKYSPLNSIIDVTWKVGQKQVIFESVSEIMTAEKMGRVEFNRTGIVINTPQIAWADEQMMIHPDKAISDEMSFEGGQVIEIDKEEMTVTFISHRGWGPDGRTIYYIITDATPARPAKTMGVVSSLSSANLMTHYAAADLYQFKNGIKGSGPLGFQPIIAGASVGDVNYSPMWRIYLVEWNNSQDAKILETKSDIDSFQMDDLITVSLARPTSNNYIINSPIIDPFQ